MIIYGDDQVMLIMDGIMEMLGQKDSDHVQSYIMCLVYENGISYLNIGVKVIQLNVI